MGSEDRGDRDQQVPERCDAWREDRQRGHAGVEADIRPRRAPQRVDLLLGDLGLKRWRARAAVAHRAANKSEITSSDPPQKITAARSACLGSPQPSACSETAERHRHQQGEITRALAKRNRRKTVGWTSQMPPIVRKLVT